MSWMQASQQLSDYNGEWKTLSDAEVESAWNPGVLGRGNGNYMPGEVFYTRMTRVGFAMEPDMYAVEYVPTSLGIIGSHERLTRIAEMSIRAMERRVELELANHLAADPTVHREPRPPTVEAPAVYGQVRGIKPAVVLIDECDNVT